MGKINQYYEEVESDVYLIIEEHTSPWKFSYYIEYLKSSDPIKFTLDFEGSQNIKLQLPDSVKQYHDESGQNLEAKYSKISCFVRPFAREFLTSVYKVDENNEKTVDSRCYLKVASAVDSFTEDIEALRKKEKELCYACFRKNEREIGQLLKRKKSQSATSFFPWRSQELETLNCKQLRQFIKLPAGEKFVDLSFPPVRYSFFGENETVLSDTVKDLVAWRTTSDIYGKHQPVFPNSKSKRCSIRGGYKHDSFGLRNAIAILSEFHHCIRNIFATENDCNIAGSELQKLQLFENGECKTIIIDDYIPCHPNAGPFSIRCLYGNLWPLFVEKAYAKLKGGYVNLIHVKTADAIEELTGCSRLTHNFDLALKNSQDLDDIWVDALDHINSGCIVLLSLDDKICASVIEIKVGEFASDSFKVTLRDPWDEISNRLQDEKIFASHIEQTLTLDSGAICKCFDSISIFNTYSSKMPVSVTRRFHLLFRKQEDNTILDLSASILFSVPSPCSISFVILTKNSPSIKEVSVFFIQENYSKKKVSSCRMQADKAGFHAYLNLIPGEYIITPTVHNEDLPMSGAQFRERGIDDLFEIMDSDLDNVLSFEDIKNYMRIYEGIEVEDTKLVKILRTYGSSGNKLTLHDLKKCYSVLNTSVTTTHMDEDVQMLNQKYTRIESSVFSIKCSTEITVQLIPYKMGFLENN